MARRAVLAGATGLVGRALLERLLAGTDYSRVVAVGRRAPSVVSPKLEARVADFSRLDDVDLAADDAFCCLGTTRKAAGSAEAFRRVDYDYALNFARAVRGQGARRFFLVSSVGANARSPFLYQKVKGELEQAVKAVGFEEVAIFRPSLLVGKRQRPRFAETFFERLLALLEPLMIGPLSQQRPIRAETVAAGIMTAAKQTRVGVALYQPNDIRRLAAVN